MTHFESILSFGAFFCRENDLFKPGDSDLAGVTRARNPGFFQDWCSLCFFLFKYALLDKFWRWLRPYCFQSSTPSGNLYSDYFPVAYYHQGVHHRLASATGGLSLCGYEILFHPTYNQHNVCWKCRINHSQ